jgi:hypothetical protein
MQVIQCTPMDTEAEIENGTFEMVLCKFKTAAGRD